MAAPESGIERATIGMLSWVGIVYTLKFLWAPVVDRLPLPVLHRLLGRRRSWMLLAQAGIASALLNMAHLSPEQGTSRSWRSCALLVAFSSATQDISVDAWRIESAPQREQGAMAAAYQLGYRMAIMVASAGALWIAADHGWARSYTTMAVLACVGVVTTLLSSRARRARRAHRCCSEQRVVDWLVRTHALAAVARDAGAWFVGAVVCPLHRLLRALRRPTLAVLMLAFIGELPADRLHDGLDGEPVLHRSRVFAQADRRGREASTACSCRLLGMLIGGVAVARLGTVRSLVLGSVLVIVSNLVSRGLARASQPNVVGLAIVISSDNLAQGVAWHGA